jgi:hypothetical protein
MTYLSETGQQLRIHDHPADQTCHWVNVFQPLAFIVFRDAQLARSLVQSPYLAGKELDAGDPSTYAKWLGKCGINGMLNLLNVFHFVCELRGPPSSPR